MKIKESYMFLWGLHIRSYIYSRVGGCILEVTYLTLQLSEAETVIKLWTPMSDQDRISPHYLYSIMQTSNENEEKDQVWDW